MINRSNYEEYFLLYIDQELNQDQQKAVDQFLQENPDLKPELTLLKETLLNPEQGIECPNLEDLYKTSGIINHQNCESYFILYHDNELTNEEKTAVEVFVYQYPQFQENFELMQQLKFSPNTSIVFTDKKSLYKKEKSTPVLNLQWWKIAVAAVFVLSMGGLAIFLNQPEPVPTSLATQEPGNKPTPALVQSPVEKRLPITEETNLADFTPEIHKEKNKVNVPSNLLASTTVTDIATPESVTAARPEINLTSSAVTLSPEQQFTDPSVSEFAVTAQTLTPHMPLALNINGFPENLNSEEPFFEDTKRHPFLRGIVRKASRIIEKTTRGFDDETGKTIKIANLEIGL